MKHTLIAFVLLYLASAPVQAGMYRYNQCMPLSVWKAANANKFAELLHGRGIAGSKRQVGVARLYVNPVTRAWTLTVMDANKTVCIVAAGQDWEFPGVTKRRRGI